MTNAMQLHDWIGKHSARFAGVIATELADGLKGCRRPDSAAAAAGTKPPATRASVLTPEIQAALPATACQALDDVIHGMLPCLGPQGGPPRHRPARDPHCRVHQGVRPPHLRRSAPK